METLREISAQILGKLDHPTACVTSLDAERLRAALDLGDNLYVVQALTHGSADAQVVFLSAAEACAFRDECRAFEATRYTEDAAEEAGIKGYMTLREEFDQRHPWRRFSRGVRFVARSQAVGRPVKGSAGALGETTSPDFSAHGDAP